VTLGNNGTAASTGGTAIYIAGNDNFVMNAVDVGGGPLTSKSKF
jgi:hypothetical protein